MYFDSKNNAIVSTYQPLPSIKASISVLQDNPEDWYSWLRSLSYIMAVLIIRSNNLISMLTFFHVVLKLKRSR